MVMTDFGHYPRIVDCFPPLKPLPGCSVPVEQAYSSSLNYGSQPSLSSSTPSSSAVHVPSRFPFLVSPSDDEEIAIPSGMPSTTKISDLPNIPPPPQYWKLKKLDSSSNVMDYWIKGSQEWDLDGIESDISLCLDQSNKS